MPHTYIRTIIQFRNSYVDMTGAGHSPARMHAKRGTSFLLCRRSRVSRFACTFYLDQGILLFAQECSTRSRTHKIERARGREGEGGGGRSLCNKHTHTLRISNPFPHPPAVPPLPSGVSEPKVPAPPSSPLPQPPHAPAAASHASATATAMAVVAAAMRFGHTKRAHERTPTAGESCRRQDGLQRRRGRRDAIIFCRGAAGGLRSEAVNAVLEAHLLNPVLASWGGATASWGSTSVTCHQHRHHCLAPLPTPLPRKTLKSMVTARGRRRRTWPASRHRARPSRYGDANQSGRGCHCQQVSDN